MFDEISDELLYGNNARHVSAWMYVQNVDATTVSFVGSSRIKTAGPHPLRYGSERSHQLLVGELIVRPYAAIGTDVLRGTGLGGLATKMHDIPAMLRKGEIIIDTHQQLG